MNLKTIMTHWAQDNYQRRITVKEYRTSKEAISLQLSCACEDDVHEHIFYEGWIIIHVDHALIVRPWIDKNDNQSVMLEQVNAADPIFFAKVAAAIHKMIFRYYERREGRRPRRPYKPLGSRLELGVRFDSSHAEYSPRVPSSGADVKEPGR